MARVGGETPSTHMSRFTILQSMRCITGRHVFLSILSLPMITAFAHL